MANVPNVGPPLKGERDRGNIADERRHFYSCPTCGRPVDMRDLRQVMLHETPGHGQARRRASRRRRS
ncbi:hypothetical protein EJ068_22945 [Mesorhizobium sp. M2A.F.Ca.ET.043.02.1.1]|nr:hypothetical protein EJ068_22945 [Mesorhizobium sp. M2A.F.Ca.ET.043.02.1.1]